MQIYVKIILKYDIITEYWFQNWYHLVYFLNNSSTHHLHKINSRYQNSITNFGIPALSLHPITKLVQIYTFFKSKTHFQNQNHTLIPDTKSIKLGVILDTNSDPKTTSIYKFQVPTDIPPSNFTIPALL